MSSFNSSKYKEEIDFLREKIQYHRSKYYAGDPEITDADFDILFNRLKNLEKEFPVLITNTSPTQTIRFPLQTELKKSKHFVPMISLDNAYSSYDLKEWEGRWKKFVQEIPEDILYIVEPKLDGLGISCIFENGEFIRAVTRGDGEEGEDVSENIKTFLPNFSIGTDSLFEIRGEVIMKKSEFIRFNNNLLKNNKTPFSNPRNAAVGSLRQLDSRITKERNLSVFFYETPLESQKKSFLNYKSVLSYFDTQKIPHSPYYFCCKKLEEVIEKIEYIASIRESLDYDIDGVVVKINSFSLRDKIGATNHHPRWAIAYKFPAKQVSTTIISVEWQVGRTGVLTPVAHLNPVVIDGVTVKRATLHNADHIFTHDIFLYDEVILERSGDVIPKIIMPIVAKRIGKEQKVEIPTHCPACGCLVSQKEEEVAIRCTNSSCPEILKGKIEYFAGKKSMNIDGLGTQVAENLVDKKIITTLSELFTLSENDLFQITGFQKKSVQSLFYAIQKSRKNPLWRWISGASIPLVGEKTAKTLASYFITFDNLKNASFEDLLQIPEVGEKVAKEIIHFLNNSENQKIFSYMILEERKKSTDLVFSKNFAGMLFVFTGTLSSITREKASELVEQQSGKVASSLSKNTSVLVCGENSGSKKNKAQELGVSLWTEKEFLEKISIEMNLLQLEKLEEEFQVTLF